MRTRSAFRLRSRFRASVFSARLAVFDGSTGAISHTLQHPEGQPQTLNTLAFDARAGHRLATGGNDNDVHVWDLKSDDPGCVTLEGHTDWVRVVRFAPGGALLASGADDQSVRLWKLASGETIWKEPEAHEDSVHALAFDDEGSHLATASWDGSVRVWDIERRTALSEPLSAHEGSVHDVCFDRDGLHLLSAGADGVLLRWELETMTRERRIESATSWTAASFSTDGSLLATAREDGSVRVWSVATGATIGPSLHGHSKSVFGLSFSHDGRLLVSAGADGGVRHWPARSTWPELARVAAGRSFADDERETFLITGRASASDPLSPTPSDRDDEDAAPTQVELWLSSSRYSRPSTRDFPGSPSSGPPTRDPSRWKAN